MTRKMINCSLKSFTVSEGCQSHFYSLGVEKEKVEVIKNGFDQTRFTPESGEKGSVFKVAFHGNLGYFQEIEKLTQLMKDIGTRDRDIEFHVWGDGPKSRFLRDYLGENLVFHGQVGYDQAAKEISNCHLGISFRTEDPIGKIALPVKVFEYIGVGIPVVISPESEIGDEINRHGFGFVADYSKLKDCADYIISLKNNQEYYKSLCQRVDEKRFSYSRANQSKKLMEKINENWHH